MEKENEDVSFVNTIELLEVIRDNNMTTIESVCELIDNSLDANAQNVWVDFAEDKKANEIWLLVQDDGDGIEKDNIRTALQFGGTLNPRTFSKKIGRFGMGLSNACAAQSPKSIIASKIKDDKKIWTNEIDFDYLKKHKAFLPKTYELSEDHFIMSQKRFQDSGTMVFWSTCDKLDKKKPATLNSAIIEAVSTIYRHFINQGINIYVNFVKVELIDPLCRLENHRYKNIYGVEKLYADPVNVPIDYINEEGKRIKSNVVVEVILLDIDKIMDNKELWNKLDPSIPKQGLYLIRNGREIGYPDWYGARPYKYDHLNYIRGEIRFDSCLDRYFGIGHNKSKAYPQDVVLEAIKQRVSKIISAAYQEHERRRNARTEPKDTGSEAAKRIYESGKSKIKTKIEIEKGRKPEGKKEIATEELEKELFNKIDNDPTIPKNKKELKKDIIRRILEDKYGRGVIVSSDGPNAPIFRVAFANGKQIIMINGNHKFYEHVYEPATKDPYAYPLVDLVFYVLAEIRESAEEDQTLIDLFDEIINIFSRKYGAMLNQKEFSEVIATAKEEES